MKVTLAAPCFRRYDLLAKLFGSAEAGTRKPDRYVAVDTGGNLGATIQTGAVSFPSNTDFLWYGSNIGVSATWNRVMDAYEDLVIFSNDDVELRPDAIKNLVEAAEQNPGGDFFYPQPNATMFCVFLIKHSCFDKIGRFDERFWPCYFEDNDYHRRMKLGGAVEIGVSNVDYLHVGSATLKTYSMTERQEHDRRFNKNRQLYIQKWGGLPGHETRTTPGV